MVFYLLLKPLLSYTNSPPLTPLHPYWHSLRDVSLCLLIFRLNYFWIYLLLLKNYLTVNIYEWAKALDIGGEYFIDLGGFHYFGIGQKLRVEAVDWYSSGYEDQLSSFGSLFQADPREVIFKLNQDGIITSTPTSIERLGLPKKRPSFLMLTKN